MPETPQEIEWQFDVADLERARAWLEERLGGAFGPEVRLDDQYLDTPDRRFFRAGRTLRLRRKGAKREATLKTHASSEEGLRQRTELNEPVEHRGRGLPDLKALPGEVGRRVRDVAGAAPIETVFAIRTMRRVWTGELGGLPCEVALDATSVLAGRDVRPLGTRLEIEVAEITPDASRLVSELREELGAEPCELSKPEAARHTLGLPPEPPAFEPAPVRPEDPAAVAARKVLRKHFEAMLAREPGTRLGDDIEELHQMRVATRRLRAAFSLFRELLPPRAEAVREQFRWLGGLLGEVRDLDVQLQRLEAWRDAGELSPEAAGQLLGKLQERRHVARAAMLGGLEAARYTRLLGSMERLVSSPAPRQGPAHAPIALVGPSLIQRRRRAARKAGDGLGPGSPPEAYHAMRIRAKRLRYAIEFLADLYGKPAKEYVRRLVALQDLLGEHQDDYVAIDLLTSLAAEPGPASAAFEMGRLAGKFEENAARLRADYPERYAATRGKPWRALARLFERHLSEGWRLMDAAQAPPAHADL